MADSSKHKLRKYGFSEKKNVNASLLYVTNIVPYVLNGFLTFQDVCKIECLSRGVVTMKLKKKYLEMHCHFHERCREKFSEGDPKLTKLEISTPWESIKICNVQFVNKHILRPFLISYLTCKCSKWSQI